MSNRKSDLFCGAAGLVAIIAMLMGLTGCSIAAPKLSDCGEFVDRAIVCHANALVDHWESHSTDTGSASVGSRMLVAGTSIGAVAAVGGPAVIPLTLATSLLISFREILGFTARSNAYNDGRKKILLAIGAYWEDLTEAGMKNAPTSCVSPYGAQLNSVVNAAKVLVADLLIQTLPPDTVQEKAKAQRLGLLSQLEPCQ